MLIHSPTLCKPIEAEVRFMEQIHCDNNALSTSGILCLGIHSKG
jgi:hypothetical protein